MLQHWYFIHSRTFCRRYLVHWHSPTYNSFSRLPYHIVLHQNIFYKCYLYITTTACSMITHIQSFTAFAFVTPFIKEAAFKQLGLSPSYRNITETHISTVAHAFTHTSHTSTLKESFTSSVPI